MKRESVDALVRERGRLARLLESLPSQIRALNQKIRIATFPSREKKLTKRQREILMFVREDLSNKEIGSRLNISERCVKFHVSRLIAKCLKQPGFAGSRREL